MTDSDLQRLLETWQQGWAVWDTIYYLSGVLLITLPIIAASDLLSAYELPRKILLLASAVLAGLVTWLNPGGKDTAHEQAYNCLHRYMLIYPSDKKGVPQESPQDKVAREALLEKCFTYVTYIYTPTGKSDQPPQAPH